METSVTNPDEQLARVKTLHDICRDYMKHEDDLINQRSTWHNVIQGFLFAGVVHILDKKLVYLFAGLGILIAVLAFISCRAADIAINELCKRWNSEEVRKNGSEAIWELMPGLAGGGSGFAKRWGKLPALCIPAVIAVAWTCIVVFITAFRR